MLGKLIKKERKLRGLTQEEVALDLNIAKSTYSSWENGNAVPSLLQLKNLCEYYHVSADYLLELTAENPIITIGLPNEIVVATRAMIHALLKCWKKRK